MNDGNVRVKFSIKSSEGGIRSVGLIDFFCMSFSFCKGLKNYSIVLFIFTPKVCNNC